MAGVAISRELMIEAGLRIQRRVNEFKDHARQLFYAIMLFQRGCVSCGSTGLLMNGDGRCHCHVCGAEFDPTIAFQKCPDCEKALILKIQHYWCPHCQEPVRSLFCFDRKVFDAAYFREMMRESRDRKQREVERLQKFLLEARSPPFWPHECPLLEDPVQFEQDLAGVLAALPTDMRIEKPPTRARYDMKAYRNHILDRVQGCVVEFEGVSALLDDRQLDRIYRFITVVFLDHEGLLEIEHHHDGRIKLVGS